LIGPRGTYTCPDVPSVHYEDLRKQKRGAPEAMKGGLQANSENYDIIKRG